MATARRTAALGRYGEQLAADHLVASGLTVLARNWRCARGELDLVLRDGDVLVFCEVKTRASAAFGAPLEAVTAAKVARLRRLALRWMREHAVYADDVRLDLVGVRLDVSGPGRFDHVRGVG